MVRDVTPKLIFSVITCPPVPLLTHADVNTTTALYGTYVQFSCHAGHLFNSSSSDVTITCLDSGNWSYVPADCIGGLLAAVSVLLLVKTMCLIH